LVQLFGEFPETGGRTPDFLQTRVLPTQGLELLGIRSHRRIGEPLLDFGRACERGLEPRLQGYPSF
jgi:hypothetical protein